jgi:hypothetical protein
MLTFPAPQKRINAWKSLLEEDRAFVGPHFPKCPVRIEALKATTTSPIWIGFITEELRDVNDERKANGQEEVREGAADRAEKRCEVCTGKLCYCASI